METTTESELRDAKYEAERYRRDVDDLRRRESEREKERDRQRDTERRQRDPSNRLYNGDVGDFSDAIRCHIACLQREIVSENPGEEPGLRELTKRTNATMREAISSANRACNIYDAVMRDAQSRVVADLRAAGLDDWADCLESGDYSSMAV
jgi:hypothetical protein